MYKHAPVTQAAGRCTKSALAIGDVHYYSFDGMRTDFQGACSYQLSEVCDIQDVTKDRPYFRMVGRQAQKQPSSAVTWLYGFEFEWSGTKTVNQTIKIRWDYEENQRIAYFVYDNNGSLETEDLKFNHFYKDLNLLVAGNQNGDIYFGFSISRVFTIVKPKTFQE